MNAGRFLLTSLLIVSAIGVDAKQNTLAVLSSELMPYLDAFKGFQENFGAPDETLHLATDPFQVRGQPRLVLAFGGKAAQQGYPENSALVYCMAPGTYLPPANYHNTVIQISMMPAPSTVFSHIRELQPSAKRLGILWNSPAYESYIEILRRLGKEAGVEVISERLDKPKGLPDRLRDWQGKIDALFITADPILANSENLVLITQFSYANHTPFYAAVGGLADKGATASFSVSFSEIGHTTASVAKDVLANKTPDAVVYSSVDEMDVNLIAAQKAGLPIESAATAHAKRVIK